MLLFHCLILSIIVNIIFVYKKYEYINYKLFENNIYLSIFFVIFNILLTFNIYFHICHKNKKNVKIIKYIDKYKYKKEKKKKKEKKEKEEKKKNEFFIDKIKFVKILLILFIFLSIFIGIYKLDRIFSNFKNSIYNLNDSVNSFFESSNTFLQGAEMNQNTVNTNINYELEQLEICNLIEKINKLESDLLIPIIDSVKKGGVIDEELLNKLDNNLLEQQIDNHFLNLCQNYDTSSKKIHNYNSKYVCDNNNLNDYSYNQNMKFSNLNKNNTHNLNLKKVDLENKINMLKKKNTKELVDNSLYIDILQDKMNLYREYINFKKKQFDINTKINLKKLRNF